MITLASREAIWGGGEAFLATLADELETLGHLVRYRVAPDSELARRAPQRMRSFWSRAVPARRIVANDFRSVWVSLLRDGVAHRVFVVHGQWQLSPLRALILRVARVRVTCVNTTLAAAAAALGIQSPLVLPLGPKASRDTQSDHRSFDVPDAPCFGNVARLDPVKRLDLFARWVGEIGASGILVCPAPRDEAEQRMIDSLRESPGLEVYADGDPAHVWHEADVFLSTSLDESLGLAMLEALSHGLPVVTTASQGPADFLTGPLASGLLPSDADVPNALRDSLTKIRRDSVGYGREAAKVLHARGPRACALQILTELQ